VTETLRPVVFHATHAAAAAPAASFKRRWCHLCRSAIACCVGVEEGRLQCSVLLRLEVGRGVGSGRVGWLVHRAVTRYNEVLRLQCFGAEVCALGG
jgi:hypothetical protein